MSAIALAAFAKRVASYKKTIEDRMRQIALEGAKACVPIVQEQTRAENMADTGAFERGWRAKMVGHRPALVNLRPGAPFIEYGRHPGKAPPPQVIYAWVVRKLGLHGAEARKAAFLIGRKIAENGLKGHHILRKSRQKINKAFAASVKTQLRTIWERSS